jgi:hypothetical protein
MLVYIAADDCPRADNASRASLNDRPSISMIVQRALSGLRLQ